MFQPFLSLTKKFLDGLIRLNKLYLVSQSYPRGADHFNNEKIPILFTDYDSLGQAQIHKSAMGGDKLAAIIDLSKPSHIKKMEAMLSPDSKYLLYWSTVKDKELTMEVLKKKYIDHIRRYINTHTSWSISRGEKVNVHMQVMYGFIFVDIHYRNQQIRVKFEEIEKNG